MSNYPYNNRAKYRKTIIHPILGGERRYRECMQADMAQLLEIVYLLTHCILDVSGIPYHTDRRWRVLVYVDNGLIFVLFLII